ncbi:MAG: short-chain dehydrogenase [Rhizobiales bacterium 65-9]|nr:SDR family oxidoreductase [Hyphomicrobiales bacterium]OJY39261.1 MAG: short-chain dehydrogenase [Rhizobiales bacterium 65-9]
MPGDDPFQNASLKGRIAVVTGGTQGLGEAIARVFAARGAAGLVICGRNADKGGKVAASLEAEGCKALYVRADLARVEDCRAVIAAADRAFGRVDALVNAGASTDRGSILDTAPDVYDAIMAVNVRAPFFLMQDAIKIMLREKIAGSIVNIQSISAHGGQPFLTPYSVSKGALMTLTKNVAFAMMSHRIRVNGLNVGWMDTPGEDAIVRKYHGKQDGWLAEAEQTQPWGRLVKPDEIARACAYLCSDESGLMSGANIDFAQMVPGANN